MSLGGSGRDLGGFDVEGHNTLWKAAPDVFVVAAPAAAVIDEVVDTMSRLRLVSHEWGLGFVIHTRHTRAAAGPAAVFSAVAERGEGRRTAAVVSVVVGDEPAPGEGRRVVVRTHLEDDHTPVSDSNLTFEEHHDAMRAALIEAIRRVDWRALHVRAPMRPVLDPPRSPLPVAASPPTAGPSAVDLPAWSGVGIDPRSFVGLALVAVGVATMLTAIATGSLQLMVGGVALGVCLGWAGSRLDSF